MKRTVILLIMFTMIFCHGCAQKNEIESSPLEESIYYTVSFVQDGQGTKTFTVEKGKALDESKIPQIMVGKLGYTATWEEKGLDAINSDLTINVVYTPNEYKIFYYLEKGGEVYHTQDVTYDEKFVLLNSPNITDKTFIRWACVNIGDSIPEKTWTKDGDLELYAVWEVWTPFG